MKDKIIIFIVGLLLGAIISTASIYIYTLANNSNNNNNPNEMGTRDGNPPELPNGQNGGSPGMPNEQ